ncbi:MAG TPA: MltA domain-containing protein [Thiobacillaceae bacterium]|nr:MltA domain-containing protein [Thiobacillaceae bacterium]
MTFRHGFAALLVGLVLAACQTLPPIVEARPAPPLRLPSPLPSVPFATQSSAGQLRPVDWPALASWNAQSVSGAWPAFLQSCDALRNQAIWQTICATARAVDPKDASAQQRFFEENFLPYSVASADNSLDGTITGYYEPVIKGDRIPSEGARFPVYGVPNDLIAVDMGSLYPELKNLRLRGRLEGNKLVPYYSRAEIESGDGRFEAQPIAWAEDPVELFFLQIQGSGLIELPNGERMHVGYADQNGHPYRSIGRLLVERGELKLEESSMQGIKDWARRNPDKLPELLASNPSYVFFRELPNELSGPLGALGVPLTVGRSIAVDPKFIPLGAPVFLSTTEPLSNQALDRLVMAQDTGGAIAGPVRADLFCGVGPGAGELAGRMKQKGRLWVLLPKDYPLQSATRSP